MRILLTNDDGIHAPGLLALWQELRKIGQVTVVAPGSQRSSIGHAITLMHPIFVKKINKDGKFFGYATSGTPADCVKFALAKIYKRKPDLVISGINLGPNEGCSVIYSGTVAGAREGAISGIPSIAVSLGTFENPDFKIAARFTSRLVKMTSQLKIPAQTFLNVNVPNQPISSIKGVVKTFQGMSPIHGKFIKHLDPNKRDYYWMGAQEPKTPKDLNNDIYALRQNYITITPIQCDTTDRSFLKKLKNITFRI